MRWMLQYMQSEQMCFQKFAEAVSANIRISQIVRQ